MEIKSEIHTSKSDSFEVIYRDIDSECELKDKIVQGVHAYCFYKDKLVIVFEGEKNHWNLPGGGREKGETVIEASIREVHEESNMKVLRYRLIGYQDIYEADKIITQTRIACIVEPYGPFIEDPDGDITKILLINPWELKKYVDWGEVGDHILKRAIKIKEIL